MKISFADATLPKSGALAVGIWAGRKLTEAASDLDRRSDGLITRALSAAGRFSGKQEELLPIVGVSGLEGLSQLILVGLGDPAKLDTLVLQRVGGALQAHLAKVGASEATFLFDALDGAAVPAAQAAAELAFGALLRSYRFDKYRTTLKEDQKPSLKKLTLALPDKAGARKLFERHQAVAEGVFLTRDLVSEPANVLYPETFAERCQELAELGIEVEVLDEKKMRKLGMGALLAVGQGSDRESRMVVMQWKGGGKEQPVAFVGKGVTFDTGGISIKPAQGMEDMKWDMGGAGVVVGLMKALAGRKAKVNAVGVIGLVENMPSGKAQRPGDVVTSMSGQTIEVLNTDAEGRLVLADALWYTQDRFKPQFMVDLATLTGAIIVSLGSLNAGLFSNDDALSDRLISAGKAVDEPVWRMPLGDAYDRQIDSDIADVKNIGGGREGGAIIAAQFLQRFVNGVPWAHLDIAGMVWSKKDGPVAPKGGTGYGVRLLDRFIADNYEG